MKKIALNNKKTKQWILSIVTILLQGWAFISNPFRKNKITHLFFWSNNQGNIGSEMFMLDMSQKKDTYIKNKRYSEMREIGSGFSNWEDAVIVGIGGYNDVWWGE
jgi:hypothetical protein